MSKCRNPISCQAPNRLAGTRTSFLNSVRFDTCKENGGMLVWTFFQVMPLCGDCNFFAGCLSDCMHAFWPETTFQFHSHPWQCTQVNICINMFCNADCILKGDLNCRTVVPWKSIRFFPGNQSAETIISPWLVTVVTPGNVLKMNALEIFSAFAFQGKKVLFSVLVPCS